MHNHSFGLENGKELLMVGNFLANQKGLIGINATLADLLRSRGWRVITASSNSNRFRRLQDMLWHVLTKRQEYRIAQVDVFSGSAFVWAEFSCQLLRFLKKPYVITLRGGNLPSFARKWPGRVNHMLTGASLVTTPSFYLQNEFKKFREDIIYLPNGIRIEEYPYRCRENLKPNICWLRAFHEIYHPVMAVEVASIIKKDIPEVQLTMIGPDKGDGSLTYAKRLAEKENLSANIRFLGAVPKSDVPIELSKYDMYLNTTHYESFGVAVLEAAAVGLPIVSTSVGEIPYLWADEEEVLIVPDNDPYAMARAVKRLLEEPGLAANLSRNARIKAQTFDWSKILPCWEEYLVHVIQQGS